MLDIFTHAYSYKRTVSMLMKDTKSSIEKESLFLTIIFK